MEDKIKELCNQLDDSYKTKNKIEFCGAVITSRVAKEYWFEQFKELFKSAHECGYFYFDDNHVWMYEEINSETEYGFEDWYNKQKELL